MLDRILLLLFSWKKQKQNGYDVKSSSTKSNQKGLASIWQLRQLITPMGQAAETHAQCALHINFGKATYVMHWFWAGKYWFLVFNLVYCKIRFYQWFQLINMYTKSAKKVKKKNPEELLAFVA